MVVSSAWGGGMLKRFGVWLQFGLFALLCLPFVLLLCLPFVLLGFVLMPLGWLIDEVSGEAEWFRRQRRRMTDDRPPLPDADLVRSEMIGEEEASLWLAARRAVAESLGLPCESIYPEDQLSDLWRMSAGFPIFDPLDIVFRLERSLAVKISRDSIQPCFYDERGLRQGEFRDLMACIATVLRSLPEAASRQRAS
jgi:hypothetical protein